MTKDAFETHSNELLAKFEKEVEHIKVSFNNIFPAGINVDKKAFVSMLSKNNVDSMRNYYYDDSFDDSLGIFRVHVV